MYSSRPTYPEVRYSELFFGKENVLNEFDRLIGWAVIFCGSFCFHISIHDYVYLFILLLVQYLLLYQAYLLLYS